MPRRRKELVARRTTYVAISGTFLSTFAAFALRKAEDLRITPLDMVQLGFATHRLGRLIAYDKVMETYRAPFTQTVSDPTGAGETVEPKGQGVQRAVGELLSCPICSGTWAATVLVYGLGIAPKPTRAFMAIMSAIGMAEVLNAVTEALAWSGQQAREEVGEHEEERQHAGAPRAGAPG